jgi:HD-like signal output (HDOD) protein
MRVIILPPPHRRGIVVILNRIATMLRDLFRTHTPPKEDKTAELAARLQQNVLALVGNMPALPDTTTRAMALADDPDVAIGDLARLIEGDVAIATGVLRMANSVFYSGGATATKLLQAVARLGKFQCKNLIVSISMKSLLWKMAGDERKQSEVLWHHGQVTGNLCHRINRTFRLVPEGAEFAAGLLHDLGRILLLLADPDCFKRAGAMDFLEEPGLLQRERSAIGIDHCALGGWFGEHSKLPDALIEVIRLHHEPDLSEQSNKLVALVAAADHMANHLQRGEDIERYNPQENLGLAELSARWGTAKKARLLDEVHGMMEDSLRAAAGEEMGG